MLLLLKRQNISPHLLLINWLVHWYLIWGEWKKEKLFSFREGETIISGQGKGQVQNKVRWRSLRGIGRVRGGRGGSQGRGRSSDKSNKKCYHCNRFSHFENEYRIKATNEARGSAYYGEE